jgi:hypothetical protein
MTASAVQDTDGEYFPDAVSVTYGKDIKKLPAEHVVNVNDVAKFWVTYYEHYNDTEGDDLLLSKNCVPYVGTLVPGDKLFFFDVEDLRDIVFKEV